jgi:serine/threonine protein phosphatase 1
MIRRLFRSETAAPALPADRRVYAVGDIHGRLDLFDELLKHIETDHRARQPAEADVILLGDLIDRGPASAAVVRRAMKPLGWARLITLRGNHEAALLDTLDGIHDSVLLWLANGGRESLRSWGVAENIICNGKIDELIEATRKAISPTERAWLARTRQYVQVGDYFFVHAGVRPGVELPKQALYDSLWIRDEFLNSRRWHDAVVVHGHSISAEVEERFNRIGIDTGAYATGRLTAVGLEGTERWFLQTSNESSRLNE